MGRNSPSSLFIQIFLILEGHEPLRGSPNARLLRNLRNCDNPAWTLPLRVASAGKNKIRDRNPYDSKLSYTSKEIKFIHGTGGMLVYPNATYRHEGEG